MTQEGGPFMGGPDAISKKKAGRAWTRDDKRIKVIPSRQEACL